MITPTPNFRDPQGDFKPPLVGKPRVFGGRGDF